MQAQQGRWLFVSASELAEGQQQFEIGKSAFTALSLLLCLIALQ
jgi:hypothetical protein